MATTHAISSQASQPVSKGRRIAGWILSALAILFLAFDGVLHVLRPPVVLDAFRQLGFPPETSLPLGVLLLICVALYAIPRTSVAGAVLLTGYLGGAIATNVRASNPLFSHVLFPVYVAVLVWGGLYLRDRRTRVLL